MITKQLALDVIKIDLNIQIVRSSNIKLSAMSSMSADAILEVLRKKYTNVGITIVNNIDDLNLLVSKKPDAVFLGMQYILVDSNNDGQLSKLWLSDFMEKNNIAYTGSKKSAHRLGLFKHEAKQIVLDAGLKTSPFIVVKCDNKQKDIYNDLIFPLFVKPTCQGGGAGIDINSVVNNIEELKFKVGALSKNNWADSLVENYLTGREFSVAVIKSENSDKLIAMPIELVTEPDENGISILSRVVKSSNEENVLAVIDSCVFEKVSTLAINVFNALGARDYGRIDIRMDENDIPYFLEANLIPSIIGGYGSFPKACLINCDLDYEPMIFRILDMAIARI